MTYNEVFKFHDDIFIILLCHFSIIYKPSSFIFDNCNSFSKNIPCII